MQTGSSSISDRSAGALPATRMEIPMKNKSIMGVLGDTARWSFQGRAPNADTAWAEPVLVMVDARKLSAALHPRAGNRSPDKVGEVFQWIAERDEIHAPVACLAQSGDRPTVVLQDGNHTLDALIKMGCEEVCLAVPAGQKSEFIQQFSREKRVA